MADAPEVESARHHVRRVVLDAVLLVVAAHSIILGLALLFFPLWVLRFVRWEYSGPSFWPSQAGLFLAILGFAYASAIRLRSLIWLLIGSKASALVFLVVSVVVGNAPRVVVLIACGDGAMGLAVALAFWQLKRAQSLPKIEPRPAFAPVDSG